MPRGTKDIIRKKANTGSQGKKLEDVIHKALTDMKFRVIREFPMSNLAFEQKRKQRNIDMKVSYGNMDLYLESDGKVHGDLETPTESTRKRNADFTRVGLNYILINHESIRELRKIMQLRNISIEELTEFITVYRAWEEYSKHISTGEI